MTVFSPHIYDDWVLELGLRVAVYLALAESGFSRFEKPICGWHVPC